MATVIAFDNNILRVQSQYIPKTGDSIAINGACLTAIEIFHDGFSVELSPESQNLLAIENYKDKVHMEPAMMMGDRFEGHMVQGHIDCVGTITNIVNSGNSTDFYISLPQKYISFVIPKGSITIDGVSLTINEVYEQSFRLTIIPHTLQNTLFQSYTIGSKVNIETDLFARYIDSILNKKEQKELSWEKVDSILASY